MIRKVKKILRSTRGSASIEYVFILVSVMVLIVVFLNIASVKATQDNLNTYARELCRTAEISGRVGEETTERAKELTQDTGLSPEIQWSETGKISLGGEFTVVCSKMEYVGLGGIGSWPVPLKGTASGKSETYWK